MGCAGRLGFPSGGRFHNRRQAIGGGLTTGANGPIRHQQATGGSATAPVWLGRVDTYLKFAAGAVGLVAALGFPAVYLQFWQFHVPNIFVPYDRALRAGILPAISLAASFLYLRWAGMEFRAHRSQNGGDLPPSMWPLFLPVVIGFLQFFTIWFLGMLSLFLLVFYWIVEIVVAFVRVHLEKRTLLYVALALFLVTIAARALAMARQTRMDPAPQPPAALLRLALRFKESPFGRSLMEWGEELEDKPHRFVLVWTLGAVVMFPAVSMGFLYCIRRLLEILDLRIASLLEDRHILMLGLLNVLFFSLVGIVFLIATQLASDDKEVQRRALSVLVATVLCGYLAAVGLYSFKMYAKLPQDWGGGKPIRVIFWLDKHAAPEALSGRLPRATFVQEGETIRCESIYLVHVDDRLAIVADAESPPAATMVLPRGNIVAIVAR